MKSEWILDADVLSRVGRAKWAVGLHATNNQSRIKMAVNCLPSLGAPRYVSIGLRPVGDRGLARGLSWDSGGTDRDSRDISINEIPAP